MANRITTLLDLDSKGFDSSLKSLRKDIADADGNFEKFKVGASGVFDSVKANAGALAVGAGAALIGFGMKAVDVFQDTALEAGKMSDALGMPVENMSRLIEVAGDVGVSAESLESSLGKMNVTASKTPSAFDKIGAAIVRNKDGTMDVNATFLATIDALDNIPDAAQRAEAAQKIFGKGWRDIAELVEQGSGTILSSMAAVSDAKVINEDEVKKARDLRAAQDALGDAVQDLALKAGEMLAPALMSITEKMVVLVELGEKLGWVFSTAGHLANTSAKSTDEYVQSLNDLGYGIDEVTGKHYKLSEGIVEVTSQSSELVNESIDAALAQRRLGDELDASEQATKDHADAIRDHNAGLTDAYDKLHNVTAAFKELRGEMSDRAGFLSIADGFDAVEEAGAEAYLAVASGAADAEQKMRAHEQQVLDLKEEIISYAEEVGNIPPEKVTAIITALDEGELAWAEAQIELLTRPRTIYSNIRVLGSGELAPSQTGRRAAGGPVAGGGMYQVGEGGKPEILEQNGKQYLIPGDSGHVTPFTGTASTSASAGGQTFTFNIYDASDPQRVVDAIRQFVRRNGPIQGIT